MIITREMFDEFVESAEDTQILWTDTLALIGVTVGDVPDVDVIEELEAEIARLREAIAGPAAWLDSWAQHVGNCQGGYVCTCGLVRARFELSVALAQETQP